jgi:hypothetical protein
MRCLSCALIVEGDLVDHRTFAIVESPIASTSSATALRIQSTVKETPSGWLISSGLRSVRSLRAAYPRIVFASRLSVGP